MFSKDIMRHRAEFAQAVRNNKYDVDPCNGLYFPGSRIFLGGVFETWLNGAEHVVSPNLIPTEALNWTLSVLVKNSSPISTWYIAPFSGNYTPLAGLAASTFPSAATEYVSYDESTRVEYVEGSVSGGSVSNSASKAEFTIATGVTNDVLYGAAILSASTKSSTAGTILAATRFASSRTVNATDILSVQYTLTLTSS